MRTSPRRSETVSRREGTEGLHSANRVQAQPSNPEGRLVCLVAVDQMQSGFSGSEAWEKKDESDSIMIMSPHIPTGAVTSRGHASPTVAQQARGRNVLDAVSRTQWGRMQWTGTIASMVLSRAGTNTSLVP